MSRRLGHESLGLRIRWNVHDASALRSVRFVREKISYGKLSVTRRSHYPWSALRPARLGEVGTLFGAESATALGDRPPR